MKSKKTGKKTSSELRERSEEKVKAKTIPPKAMSDKETQQLIHELQVHQIELEMQNEELRRAQTELEESRTRYSDLYDFAPIGYFTFDKKGLILEANLTAAKELGVKRSVLVNKPFRTYIAAEDREIFDTHLQNVFNAENRQTCEIRLKKKDGSVFYAQMESIAVRDFGGADVCRTSCIDITSRKKAEVELKQLADELKRSNEDLKQFASAASHDLQEPLRGIEGFIKVLEKRYKGKLDEKADEYIDYIVNDIKRMQMLIKDLLIYSQVSVKSRVFSPVNCSVVLEKALDNLREGIEESEVELTYDLLPTVIGDEAQLGRLFQNLIGNAIKFRGKEPLKIRISVHQKENEWIFSIRDNGIGIDPKQAERIFVIFQRLHTRQEYLGTGVGLAICKRIVERHGGRIWLESEPEKGTIFYFTIPDRPGDLLRGGKKRAVIKVLIADDHLLLREGLKMILEETDDIQVVEEALNGQEVLDKAQEHIDIIVMDINMPKKNGFEVLEELKTRGSKIPVLILSSYPTEEFRESVIKEGAAGYVMKDQAPSQLINAIRNALNDK